MGLAIGVEGGLKGWGNLCIVGLEGSSGVGKGICTGLMCVSESGDRGSLPVFPLEHRIFVGLSTCPSNA